ncbi:SPFH domain / Band 7 family protein [Pseudobythopirellula maris]|uniref:SPFH domain / Band 7 family protein n=1 Tax=Pseudobythopirellula maris TaxID=2527991 RepID=A0A5C5ZQY0_9BACT|nr:prohibitin family protein [Pseudobythopirellula maris]TWT89889.1 SPFH domain / Band 7 family protein [Pseudobythopirellula maris]
MQINPAAVIALVVLFIAALIATNGVAVVEPGTVGVVSHFGDVQDESLQPGLHFKVPVMTDVIPVNTRVKKVEEAATASSKDLQIVTSKIALNYRIDSGQAGKIFKELGLDYPITIVQPALQESIKATSAKYTAEELITKRAEVAQEMEEDLIARLSSKSIIPTDLSIIDFNFSKEFNDAIEQKQVAQQAALRASNELERIRIEAKQDQTKAEGIAQAELARARAEAEAQQMLRETISAELLQLRAIEKWDGVLPVYTGGGESPMPFLSMPSAGAPR